MKTESLASRTRLLSPSPTLAITAKAKQLKAQGHDVVSFGAGEPDFPTPEPIVEAAIKAMRDGLTKYLPTPGMPALREAIVAKLERENDIRVSPEQVIVSCGAKHSLFNSFMTLVDPGDEVIVIAPYWMTYTEQVAIAGGKPVIVQTRHEEGFQPRREDFEAAFSSRTKAIVINSPSNPAGAVLSRETLEWLAEQAVKRDFWIISDEIYERLVYGASAVSPASLGPEVADRTVTINGCSKSFSMTGWRVGYAAAPIEVAKAMSNLQDQVTSNATSFAQAGALAALQMDPMDIEHMREEFEGRRDLILKLLRAIPGVQIETPMGAFYALPDIGRFLSGGIPDDSALATFLLEEALVATVPGSVFGAPAHVRLSYAASREDIERGVARIGQALARLSA